VDVVNPLVRVESKVTGVVILTSDSGFMGGLNVRGIRAGLRAVESVPQEQVELIFIGDKGAAALGDQSQKMKTFAGITSKLFEVFEDGKLAEFSARAMHLEGSLQKVEKEYKKVKRKCFKASHELIDKGMRESFAAKSTKDRKKKRSAV
jgi:F0F1-type ATP synthase gamma subunit